MKRKEAAALIKAAQVVFVAARLWDSDTGCDPVYIKAVKSDVLSELSVGDPNWEVNISEHWYDSVLTVYIN